MKDRIVEGLLIEAIKSSPFGSTAMITETYNKANSIRISVTGIRKKLERMAVEGKVIQHRYGLMKHFNIWELNKA